MTNYSVLLIFLFLLGCGSTNEAGKQTSSNSWDSVRIDNQERKYLIHVPSNVSNIDKPLPLILLYHGAGGNPNASLRESKFDVLANKENFIVVFPQGYQRSWADARGVSVASKNGIDDIEFTLEMLKSLKSKYNIDSKRIYAAGVSNGGFMVSTIACKIPDQFAAFATVIASIPKSISSNCNGIAKSVVMFPGTADKIVPYEGGLVWGRKEGEILGMEDTFKFWANRNNCSGEAIMEKLPDKTNDGTTVTKYTYQNCDGNSKVVFYKINGGGHQYPNGITVPLAGRKTTDINATEEIWNFFQSISE